MTGLPARLSAKHAEREYVIYNYAFPTSERRGSDWFRYGAIKNREDAEQLAADLYRSEEFICVEIHEMQEDMLTGRKQSRLIRRFSKNWTASLAARASAIWGKFSDAAA